ncbi:MAG TPA: tyrosine-type recombinase/integrase [Candidatus Binatia bacterium]|jgi:integrase/recombinase XerD
MVIKGGRVREFVPVQVEARQVLTEWLALQPKKKGPLFTPRTGQQLTRYQHFLILQRVARPGERHRRAGEAIKVSPHVLRHTFLRKLAEEKGVPRSRFISTARS